VRGAFGWFPGPVGLPAFDSQRLQAADLPGAADESHEDLLQRLAAASMFLHAGLKGTEGELRVATGEALEVLRRLMRDQRAREREAGAEKRPPLRPAG
jgi:hypothetical protein